MLKSKKFIRPAAAAVGLLAALGVAATSQAQAAPSELSTRISAGEQTTVHFLGRITAVDNGSITVATNGTVVKVSITDSARWVGHLAVGAHASITASVVNGGYVAKVIATW
ncbi:hypothetical protein [Streptomyces curacoi]|uniref:hypothetical protein n=1 Tax=Streptomyces curacoi TaxID=146536 RepID=UPI000AE86DC1|nr:hypothetical protein [Streptomyces curacoi]